MIIHRSSFSWISGEHFVKVIKKNFAGLLKGDAMLLPICFGLLGIPYEKISFKDVGYVHILILKYSIYFVKTPNRGLSICSTHP